MHIIYDNFIILLKDSPWSGQERKGAECRPRPAELSCCLGFEPGRFCQWHWSLYHDTPTTTDRCLVNALGCVALINCVIDASSSIMAMKQETRFITEPHVSSPLYGPWIMPDRTWLVSPLDSWPKQCPHSSVALPVARLFIYWRLIAPSTAHGRGFSLVQVLRK